MAAPRGRLALLLILAAAAAGCTLAEKGSFTRVQEDVEDLRKQVAALKAAEPPPAPAPAGPPAPPGDETASLRRSLADLGAETERLKSEVLAATTRLDEGKIEFQKEMSRLNDAVADLGQSMAAVRGRIARLDELESRVGGIEERLARVPAAGPAAPAAGGDWKTPEDMYDYALGLVKKGEARKGREILGAFAAKYPDHRLMPNVLYWKGEAFYAEKDFESAILAFQDVVEKFPEGDKAPDAMYKQALAFQSIKDPKNARIVLELLAAKYPKSPAAEKARQKLTELP